MLNKIKEKNTGKSTLRWNEIIFDLDNEEDLISFYEKQKKTFGSKKVSPNGSEYFSKFISSFLQIDNLSDRSCEVVGYLLRHLEEIDKENYNKILLRLKKHKDYYQIMKEKYRSKNRKKFFEFIQNFDELKDEFDKYYTMFHHLSKTKDTINNFYIPFIEKFISFSRNLNSENKDFMLRAILLLELQAYKIDEKFIEYYKLEEKLSIEIHGLLGEKSFKVRGVFKRWNYFFKDKGKEELVFYYNQVRTTFGRKDKHFFRGFIKALLKYKGSCEIDIRINTLVNHLKKKDLDFEMFLNEINFDENELVLKKENNTKKIKLVKRSNKLKKEKPKEKNKFAKNRNTEKSAISSDKVKNEIIAKKNKIKEENRFDNNMNVKKDVVSSSKVKKKEKIINKNIFKDTIPSNVQLKKKENKVDNIDKSTSVNIVKLVSKMALPSLYKKTIFELEKCLLNKKPTSGEVDLLISKMKLNDLINLIFKFNLKLSDVQKKKVYLKCFNLRDLFTVSENNFGVIKYLVEKFSGDKDSDYLFLKKHLKIDIEKFRAKKI